jgi:hypothetical protein
MMLNKSRDIRVSLNPKKCRSLQPFKKLLGYIVSKEGIMVDPNKVKLIKDLEPHVQFQIFLRLHLEYYQKYVRGYTKIAHSMEQLLKKEITFQWTLECQ